MACHYASVAARRRSEDVLLWTERSSQTEAGYMAITPLILMPHSQP